MPDQRDIPEQTPTLDRGIEHNRKQSRLKWLRPSPGKYAI